MLQATLRRVFGLRQLRVGQRAVIERVLAGHSTLALMPTGAGKSLCYQLPAVVVGGLTLVVSPLVALMKDQCESLRARGVAAGQLNASVDAAERDHAWAVLEGRLAGPRGARILFITPERLGDPVALGALREQGVRLLVVDEAHCIAQWGHDFRPAFAALRAVRQSLGEPTVLALTATATSAVQADICRTLGIPRDGVLQHGVYRPNLRLAVEVIDSEARRRDRIVEWVRAQHGSGIIYAATVHEAEHIHRSLHEVTQSAALYHGRLAVRERSRVQDAFMAGSARVMVATNAFGMGIDKGDIRWVLHAQMPASLEAYYQECGRAGRDDAPSDCLLLFREGDRAVQQFFAGGRQASRDDLAAVWRALRTGTPQAGWLASALAAVARLPMHRTEQALAALHQVRAVAKAAGGGLRAAAHRRERDVVGEAEQAIQDRAAQARDGLEAMVLYAKAGACRWAGLVAHFGQALEGTGCGHCDTCVRLRKLQEAPAAPLVTAELPPSLTAAPRPFPAGAAVVVRRFGPGVVVRSDAQSVAIEFRDHGLREIDPAFVEPAGASRHRAAGRCSEGGAWTL